MRGWRNELAGTLALTLFLLAMEFHQHGELRFTNGMMVVILLPLALVLADRLYRSYRVRRLGGIPEQRSEYHAIVDVRMEREAALRAIKSVAKRFATYSFHRNHIDLDLAEQNWLQLKHAGRTLSLRVEPGRRSVQVRVRSPCQVSLLECQRALEKLNK